MNPRRLYRSRDRQLAGVAGGMAEYLEVDPTIIRIGWILITVITGGLALIAYLVAALIIPNSPYAAGAVWQGQTGPGWSGTPGGWGGAAYGTQGWTVPPSTQPWPQQAATPVAPRAQSRGLGAAGIVGIVLVVIGAIALTDTLAPWLRIGLVLGPAIILALGVGLLISSVRRPADAASSAPMAGSTPTETAMAATASSGSSIPGDMTPWAANPASPAAASSPAPSASAGTSWPTPSDPDATATDIPVVSNPNDEPPVNPA